MMLLAKTVTGIEAHRLNISLKSVLKEKGNIIEPRCDAVLICAAHVFESPRHSRIDLRDLL